MAISPRLQRERAAAARVTPLFDYEIIDPNHKPDLHGELAGAKVKYRNGKQIITITENAARYYLDNGTIRKIES